MWKLFNFIYYFKENWKPFSVSAPEIPLVLEGTYCGTP